MPDDEKSPEGWTSRDKFAAVLETAALNETELAEYCRKKGLYPEQIASWGTACEQANDWQRASEKQLKESSQQNKKEIKTLRKELERKEKALAEAAALLVLRKKADAIWGQGEED